MPVQSSKSINVTGEQGSRKDERLELCVWHEAEAQLPRGKLNPLSVAEARWKLGKLWPSFCVGKSSVAEQQISAPWQEPDGISHGQQYRSPQTWEINMLDKACLHLHPRLCKPSPGTAYPGYHGSDLQS